MSVKKVRMGHAGTGLDTRGRRLVGLMVLACATGLLVAGAIGGENDDAADAFWQFYEEYPHYQDFFPFGLYGAGPFPYTSHWQDCSARTANQVLYDVLSDHSINFLWTGWFGLDDFGRWVYTEELPGQGIRVSGRLTPYTGSRGRGAFGKYQSHENVLTDQEMVEYERVVGADAIRAFSTAAREYSGSLVGYVIGDEPHVLPPIVAAAKLVEKHTDVPALIVENSTGTVLTFAPYLPCIAADWYWVSQNMRKSWAVVDQMRTVYAASPRTIIWTMPMTAAYRDSFDTTKPDLTDPQLTREELRFHFWSTVALGAKGFVPYKAMSWPFGLRNRKSMVDPLSRPEEPMRLLEEMGELGRDATTIGPLLLSCRPDSSFAVGVDTGTVRFPGFEGPAVEHGVLRDVKHDRFFLIPWNNDVERTRSGRITLPEDLVSGRTVYDMHELEPARIDDRVLPVQLAPGGGRIFLVADHDEFQGARGTVLRHRARRERISAWKRVRIARAQRVDVGAADDLMQRAAKAGRNGAWAEAGNLYRQVLGVIDAAEDDPEPVEKRQFGDIKAVRRLLQQTAERLSRTNVLVNTHYRPLEISLLPGYSMEDLYRNPHVGDAALEWTGLVRQYYRAQERFRTGQFWNVPIKDHTQFGFLKEARILEKQAEANLRTVDDAIAVRLAQLRKDIRVALVTPNRTNPTFALLYSFAYENTHVRWFVPDGRGGLRDRAGVPFVPGEFGAVWVHQSRFPHAVPTGKTVDPAAVLMPELVAKPMRESILKYVSEHGGGLLLTGIGGLYAVLLGIESTPPDRVLESSLMHGALSFESMPAPGYSEHPVYAGITADAMPANSVYGWTPTSVISECAWEKRVPSGSVLARQTDNGVDAEGRRKYTGFDVEGIRFRSDDYAPVVEYRAGQGKVLVLGGLSVHMMPGWGRTLKARALELRQRIRPFTLNALVYLASPARFEPDPDDP